MTRLLFALLLLAQPAAAQSFQWMTYNIRLELPGDSANNWPYRRDNLAAEVLFHKVNLLGVQEALPQQMADLAKRLPGFAWVGKGRDDGAFKGEFSAIFYDTARFALLDNSTFWLSQTPEKPGKGWDADYPRVVTWAKLKDRKTGVTFYCFNTHFDHRGVVARRESARLLLAKAQEISGGLPVLLSGDFNAQPTDEPMHLLTDSSMPYHFTYAKQASRSGHFGPEGTFTGFAPVSSYKAPIDHLLFHGPWTILRHGTLAHSWNGRWASDHFAVLAEVEMKLRKKRPMRQ